MAHPFYPFVNADDSRDGNDAQDDAPKGLSPSVVNYAARIAVYDDAAAAPRVVVVEPSDVRSYLEEITSQVTQLSHEQGGSIPFMVIREIVENFIHAYFIEPTITILDGGNTIRFSDQGPGIKEKKRALEYGTSSATDEMKRYIRGVGSGLPYAQQYMVDKGGSLTIEDNISQGAVVTISTRPATPDNVRPHVARDRAPETQDNPRQPYMPQQNNPYPYPPGTYPWTGSPAPQWQQDWQPQTPPGYQGYDGLPAQPAYPTYPYVGLPAEPQNARQRYARPHQDQPSPLAPAEGSGSQFSWVRITARGHAILDYLATHETVGPTELAREYGESQPTWTRELKQLEEDGILKKEGQKRRLTRMGEAYLESIS